MFFSSVRCAAAVLTLCLAMGPVAQAQSVDTLQITFDRAVDIALDQNTDVKRAQSAVRQQETVLTQRKFAFGPSFSASSAGQRSFGRSFSQEEGAIVNETTDFFTVNARGSINLFNGWGDVAALNQAQENAAASTLSLERTRKNVVFRVMNQYLALVQDREVLAVQREELAARLQQLEQIRAFVESGARPPSALYEQQAAVAEQRTSVLEAERAVSLDKTQLIQTLQLDPMKNYTFQAPALNEPVTAAATFRYENLLKEAYRRRNDLQAQRAEANATAYGIDVAQSALYPSLDLSVDYGSNWASTALLPVPGTGRPPTQVQVQTAGGGTVPYFVPGTGSNPTLVQPDFFDQLDNRRGGSITLSLSIPLFNRYQTRASIEQARVQALNAQYAVQDRRQQIAAEVRQAILDYRNAQQRLAAAKERLQAARLAREAAQERFRLGAASIVELTNANRNFVQAASEEVRAQYTLVFQQQLIDYYIGTLNPETPLFQ